MPSRRRAFVVALAAASAPAWPQQQQPPLKLIVPFTPGTGIDLIARTVGPRLGERLGRAVVIENRAGASGNIGTEAVVRSAPDGNTLLVTVNTVVMNRALYPKAGFDPLTDLEPVTLTSWGQLLLCASPASGIASAADLIARARARPGGLNYGSPGAGTPHHLAMEMVKSETHLFITHVPYRGTAPAVTDLVGGQIDLMFLPIHVALQLVRGGKLKALAIGSAEPSPLIPEVPPLRKVGLGNTEVDMWYGVMAPKGTPAETIGRLNGELRQILALPEVKSAFETQGMTPASSTPAEFRRIAEADAARWAAVVKAQNIRAE